MGVFKFTAVAVVVGTVFYAGAGYFGVPYATRSVLNQFVAQKLGRPIQLDDVSFNPWTLTYKLSGLHIPAKEGQNDLIALDKLKLDFSAKTFVEFAPILEEASIEGLKIDAVYNDDLKADIAALASGSSEENKASGSSSSSSDAGSGLPAFAVYNISVSNSSIRYADPASNLYQTISDIEIALPFVSTLASSNESLMTPKISMKLNGKPIEAAGVVRPFGSSLEAKLNLKIDDLDLAPCAAIIPQFNGGTVSFASGKLSSNLNFTFQNPTGGNPAKMLLSGSTTISNVSVKDAAKKPQEIARLDKATITLKKIDFVESSADIQSVAIDGLKILAVNDKEGINWVSVFAGEPTDKTIKASKTESSFSGSARSVGWRLRITEATVSNSEMRWQDKTSLPAADIPVKNITASLKNFDLAGESPANFSLDSDLLGGHAGLLGSLAIAEQNIDADVTLKGLTLKSVAPYLKGIGLDLSAAVDGTAKLTMKKGSFSASGNITASDFSVKQGKNTLVAGKSANVDLKSFEPDQSRIDINAVTVKGLVVNAVNTENGLNFANLANGASIGSKKLKADEKTASQSAHQTTKAMPWQWRLGTASLTSSTLNYKDETVKPAAGVQISSINATVKNLSSDSKTQAVLDFGASLGHGAVNGAGKFTYSPINAAVEVKASKIELKNFSTFLLHYAGIGANSGALGAEGKMTATTEGMKPTVYNWKGGVSLSNLNLVNAKGSSLMGWKNASLTGMDIETTKPIKIVVARAEIEEPAQQQVKVVKKAAGIASVVAALAGKDKTADKIEKYVGKVEGNIVLENVRYENGRFSAEGGDSASVGGIMLQTLSNSLGSKLISSNGSTSTSSKK